MSGEIGGYLSLEIKPNNFFLSHGKAVNSGRNAFEVILKSIKRIEKIWIPYFTCEVILEPLKKMKIPYDFYEISIDLEINNHLDLGTNEFILYTNYFGLKDSYVKILANKYSRQLIIDNAQALYSLPILDIKTFYSPRKFVGIPDGGIVFYEEDFNLSNVEIDYSYDRFDHLLKRLDIDAQNGYYDFRENSKKLINQPVKRISKLTNILLNSIDFEYVKNKRIANFAHLHKSLKATNLLKIDSLSSFECPMVYPYLIDDSDIKGRLLKNNIFIATYWPNVLKWRNTNDLEFFLANNILPLPIDQRYDTDDMERMLKIINL